MKLDRVAVSNVSMIACLAIVLAFLFFASVSVAQIQQTRKTEEADATISLETVLGKYRQRGETKWEEKIQELESRNAVETWTDDALLFFGSSSFRLWDSISVDMAPYVPINRGYGGAKYVDMVLFAERMLKPHQYRALMLFAANDVKGEDDDSSPAEVAVAVEEIIRVSKAHQPDAPVFIVEVTPTEARFSVWAKTRMINAALREVALTNANTWFVATAEHFLHADGNPRSDLFVDDKLHLNTAGYHDWAKLIKRDVDQFLQKN